MVKRSSNLENELMVGSMRGMSADLHGQECTGNMLTELSAVDI